MNIGIFYNTAWYIYNFRRNLIKQLQDAGHTVFAISPYDEYVPKLEQLGVKHYAVPLEGLSVNPLRELRTILHIVSLLRKIRPDVILSFTIKCNLYTGICRRFLPFHQVANVSGLGQTFEKRNFLNSVVTTLYRFGFKKTSWVFFQNKEDLDLFAKHRLVAPNRCQLLPGSGVDLRHFLPESIVSPKRRFLMFGRLLPQKGYDLFLTAAAALKPKYGDAVEFQILGVEDERRAESRALAQRVRAAADRGLITVLPKAIDVRPTLMQADVVVLPSTYNEGVPRSLLEAMACAKPLITTDWKGCRETVIQGVNGDLVPINNSLALIEIIERYITMPSEQLLALGKASRALAEQKFDEGLVIDAYLNQLQRAA